MNFKKPKRMVLSSKNIFILFAVVTLLAFGLVFFLGHKSIFTELQITFSIISLSLFIFMVIGLYNGISIAKEKQRKVLGNLLDSLQNIDHQSIGHSDVTFGNGLDMDFGDDLFSAVLAVVAWIFVTIGLLFLLSGLITFVWSAFIALVFSLYWIFYKALRRVFSYSGKCRKNLLLSIKYSLLYTALYTGWLYILVFVSKLIIQ